jgi:diguanylate cyclase (GGDEF)-like protein
MINDGLGHSAGDEALIEIARRLEQAADPANIVARLGGDEFAVLVEGEGSKKAEKAAEKLLDWVGKPFAIAGQEVFAAASAGVTRVRDEHSFAEDVLREAEVAMYQAKRTGRGRIESFRPDLRAGASELLLLESDLRRAIERREIELYYQPIMYAKDGRVAGFEALLRWLHPQRGLLVADTFINVAEETGLIVALGRYALAHASEHLARWQKYFPLTHPLFVSVNVSGRQLLKPEFARDVAAILSAVPIKPGTLKLEMTENVVMTNPDAAVATLTRLKDMGAGLALDDFGKGFSSLSYLQRYPFDTIKIDRSFVERLGEKEDSKVIISSIISLAHELSKVVVAEGVETKANAERLKAMGCDFIQGYVYGAPMSPAEAQSFISLHWAH